MEDSSRSLPVFVFPTSLSFYADDSPSQRQVLTIYNPYDFNVRFRVLSTCPQKYNVVDPAGTIKPHYGVDIVVRINDVSRAHHNKTDQFRIHLIRAGDPSESSGHRDVSATLYPTKKSNQSAMGGGDMSSSMFSMTSSPDANDDSVQRPRVHRIDDDGSGQSGRNSTGQSPNVLIILIAVACVLTLMLPVASDGLADAQARSLLPVYLHISLPQKLIAAYVLGLVTMVIFRTT